MDEDRLTERRLEKVCPDVATRWKFVRERMWEAFGRQLRVTSGYRSFAEQFTLYSIGRKRKKDDSWLITGRTVTSARPGASYHQFGLAIDSCFKGTDPYLEKLKRSEANELWAQYGKMCQQEGLEWGGLWKKPDRPHCQLSYGFNVHKLQIMYEDSGLRHIWVQCVNTLRCGAAIEDDE